MTVAPPTRLEVSTLGYLGNNIISHPDGKAWTKCCTGNADNLDQECQCFMKRPRGKRSRFMGGGLFNWFEDKRLVEMVEKKARFFCVHRKTDDGYHRECAGWFAKFGKGRE